MTGPVTTEALVEKLARDLVREGGWNDPDAPWTENQVIIARGGAGEPVWRDFVDDARSLLGRETFTSLLAAHQQVTAERDEADRRAGAAEREAERDREDARARSAWLHQAKGQAGYSTNVSFDKVWAETLEKAARADTATSELARLRAEGEAKDRALLLLLPFVDYAAGEGLMFVETEDGEHPEMDAADIMGLAAEALGLELGSDAYLALLPAGHAAIRAARAATAREGQADG